MEIKGYFVEDIPRRKFLERSIKSGIAVSTAAVSPACPVSVPTTSIWWPARAILR